MERNTIACGDVLDVVSALSDKSIDLVFTSPPYNLSMSPDGKVRSPYRSNSRWGARKLATGYDGAYSDDMPLSEWISWQGQVLHELWRTLPDDGAIYYNHKPRVMQGKLFTAYDVIPDGLIIRQIIIWDTRGSPNFNVRFYTPSCEWIALLAKPDFRLRDQGASGVADIWHVSKDQRNPHPAPFPIELPRRAIETSNVMNKDNPVVLDPFMGSGTTAAAARELGIDFLGVEINPDYVKYANRRLALTRPRGVFYR